MPQPRMSAATSFYATFQQLTLSLGICVSTARWPCPWPSPATAPPAPDFSVAFLVVTFISILASPVCARLPVDAGHGHERPGRRKGRGPARGSGMINLASLRKVRSR